MNFPLIILSLTLAIGIAIGAIIRYDPEALDLTTQTPIQNTAVVATIGNATKDSDTNPVVAEIAELNRLLRNEINARQALQQKFEALHRQVAALDSNLQSSSRAVKAEQVAEYEASNAHGSGSDWFNEQALIDNGMDSIQARQLKIYFEEVEMERLFLRDKSIRESWSRDQFREAMQTITSKEEELKNQLSESAYDSYLYASGKPNRVAVFGVLESAQAGSAGIIPGDHIIRYDSQRIYNGEDLQQAISAGNISDTVAIEVERNGKTMQFYLARGPMGIRMNSVSVAPGS